MKHGAGPGLSFLIPFSPVSNKPYGFCGRKAPRNKKVSMPDNREKCSGALWTAKWAWAPIPYPSLPTSLMNHTVSVDVKHHEIRRSACLETGRRGQELCQTRSWALAFNPYPSLPTSLMNPMVSVDVEHHERRRSACQDTGGRGQELCEQGGGPGLSFPIPFSPVPNNPYGFCGRKAP